MDQSFDPPDDVVGIRKNQQSQDDDHAHDLRIFQEFLAGFPPGNHFVQQEHHVTPVECRYGQNIHKGEDKLQKGRDFPE